MPPPTAQQACIDGCPIVPSADLCIVLRSRPADKGKKKAAEPALSHRPSRHIAAPQRFSEETILSAHQTKPARDRVFSSGQAAGLDARLSVAVACVCATDAREMSAKRSRESVGSLASDDSDSDDDLYDL